MEFLSAIEAGCNTSWIDTVMSSFAFLLLLLPATGVDLSKILGEQTKILGGKVVKGDKCVAFLNYWEARARAAP